MDEDDDELTIVVRAAPGASALERDGMLRRLEEAVTQAIAEIAVLGYLTSGDATDDEVRLVIAAPGLASPDVLGLVGNSVAGLVEDLDAAGWGPFSVNVTDEVDDDSDEGPLDLRDQPGHPDFDPLDVIEGPALVEVELLDPGAEPLGGGPDRGPAGFNPDAARLRLVQDAEHLSGGLELDRLTVPSDASDPSDPSAAGAGDPQDRAQAVVEAAYVAGALFQACVVVVDELFADLHTLRLEPEGATLATTEDGVFFVLEELPDRYADRYDALFCQELLVATVDVTRRFTTGWEPLACVAQELAVRLILDQAEVQLDLADAQVNQDWRSPLEDELFEDRDHELLFDPDLDLLGPGADLLGDPDSTPLGFEDWFTPFGPDHHLPPYLIETVD